MEGKGKGKPSKRTFDESQVSDLSEDGSQGSKRSFLSEGLSEGEEISPRLIAQYDSFIERINSTVESVLENNSSEISSS